MIYVFLDKPRCVCSTENTHRGLFYVLFPLVVYALLSCAVLYTMNSDGGSTSYYMPRPTVSINFGLF